MRAAWSDLTRGSSWSSEGMIVGFTVKSVLTPLDSEHCGLSVGVSDGVIVMGPSAEGLDGSSVSSSEMNVVGGECSKLLIAGSCKANANVTFVQGNIFVGQFAIFSCPLEGDGVGRARTACLRISLGLALLGEHLWDKAVDWCFR